MFLRYVFVLAVLLVALCALLASLAAAQGGGLLAPAFLFTAVAAPVLIVSGGWKLGKDWLGIEPP
jgi:hypothetical protein